MEDNQQGIHRHVGFEVLMLQSALTKSVLLGIAKVGMVDKTFGPLTLSDLDVFPSKDSRLGLFAGDRPMVSTLRGPPDSELSSLRDGG